MADEHFFIPAWFMIFKFKQAAFLAISKKGGFFCALKYFFCPAV